MTVIDNFVSQVHINYCHFNIKLKQKQSHLPTVFVESFSCPSVINHKGELKLVSIYIRPGKSVLMSIIKGQNANSTLTTTTSYRL